MEKNMGFLDRTLRILLAASIAILYFMDKISGIAATVLGIFAIIFVLTSFVGFCPLYAPFHLKTTKKGS